MNRHYPKKHYPDTLGVADALRYNDGDFMRHLLAEGLDPNSRGGDGRPLLLSALLNGKTSVEIALSNAGATEEDFTREEQQELALYREPLYKGRKELMDRPLLELCREQMKEAEGNQKLLAGLRDRERQLTYQAPVFNEAAFQTLLRDLKAAGISVPTPEEWPHKYHIPRTHAMAAMDILLKQGDPAWMKRLLETGVNPNEHLYRDDNGHIPLCEAAEDTPSLVPILLEYGADPSGDGGDCIPLISAGRADDETTIDLLLAAGANPHLIDWYGWTLLHCATVNESPRLVSRLIRMGVDPNDGDDNGVHLPLNWAIINIDVEIAQSLLDAGASPFLVTFDDFDIHGINGNTPLYLAEAEVRSYADHNSARYNRALKILNSIYSRYPDIDKLPFPGEDERIGYSSYLDACLWNTAAYNLRRDAGYLLRFFGASPNACNSAGIPALVIAAARGHADVVYELLCYGATPELPAHLLAAAGCQGEVDEEIRRLVQCFAPAAHDNTPSTQNPA